MAYKNIIVEGAQLFFILFLLGLPLCIHLRTFQDSTQGVLSGTPLSVGIASA